MSTNLVTFLLWKYLLLTASLRVRNLRPSAKIHLESPRKFFHNRWILAIQLCMEKLTDLTNLFTFSQFCLRECLQEWILSKLWPCLSIHWMAFLWFSFVFTLFLFSRAAILGMRAIGKGHSAAHTLSAYLNMPAPLSRPRWTCQASQVSDKVCYLLMWLINCKMRSSWITVLRQIINHC